MAASPTVSTEGPARRPWVMVAVLVTLYMAAFVDRNILTLLVEPIKADLKISDVQMSLLLGLSFSLFYAILNIPGGLVADRFDRRGVIALAALGWSIMTIVCGLAVTYWQLFFGRIGVGFAEAFITPAAFALIRDRVPAAMRGRAFSVLAMAPYIGSALALVTGSALIGVARRGAFASWPLLSALHGWQAVLVIAGVVGLPLSALMLAVPRDERVARPASTPSAWFGMGDAIRQIRTAPAFYGALGGYATMGAMLAFGYNAWVPTMMSRRFDIPASKVGLINGPVLLVSAISGLIVCGFAMDHLVRRGRNVVRYGIVAMGLSATAAALAPLMRDMTAAWACFGVATFFAGAFYSVGATILSRFTPSGVMGKVTALYLLCQTLIGSGLGPTLVALAARHWFSGPLAIGYALSVFSAAVGLGGLAFAVALARAMRAAPV